MQTPNTTATELIHTSAPNWPAIDFEVTCPRCNYNLRMLTTPRCPECGLDFDWTLVLRQSTSVSDFLFEHHWRRRPIRSFLITVWRSLRPAKFWRSVSIYDRVRPGPLVFMLVASLVWFAAVFEGFAAGAYLVFNALSQRFPPAPIVQPPVVWPAVSGSIEYRLMNLASAYSDITRLPLRAMPQCLWLPGFIAIALATILALLCGLRQTLGRCQVRTVQVLRVVAYAATPIAILAAIIEHAFFLAMILDLANDEITALCYLILTFALGLLMLYIYLVPGLRDYLRLPRPRVLAATAALVAVLTGLTSFTLYLFG